MGLCCSLFKTLLYKTAKRTSQTSHLQIEIDGNLDAKCLTKQKENRNPSPPMPISNNNSNIENQSHDAIKINIDSNLMIKPNPSSYHKSCPKSLNLESDDVIPNEKIEKKSSKPSTMTIIDLIKEVRVESPTNQSDVSIRIKKMDLILPENLVVKINKIIDNVNVKNEKRTSAKKKTSDPIKSQTLFENENNDTSTNIVKISLKEENTQIPMVEEKRTASFPNEIDLKNSHIEKKELHISQPIIEKNQQFHDTPELINKTKMTLERETTIKTTEVMSENQRSENLTEKPLLPKKSLLKYKTFGEERRISCIKKNVKFKGIGGGAKKKKKN